MKFERIKIKFKTLSPFHIGTKTRSLAPFNYVEGPDGFVYVIKESKFIETLERKGVINEFLSDISSLRFDLRSFLRSKGLFTKQFLSSISLYRVMDLSKGSGNPSPFLRNPWGKPFIPGSSVKGAIRTAVLFRLLSKERKWLRNYIKKLLDMRRRDRKKLAQKLEKRLNSFRLPHLKSRGNPHTDFMRCLRISDSDPLDENAAVLLSAEVIEPKSEGDLNIRVECLKPCIEFDLDLSLDISLLEEFKSSNPQSPLPFSNVNELLDHIKVFGEKLWEVESRFASLYNDDLVKFYSKAPDGIPIKIGWGTGILGMTVDLLLAEDLRREIGRVLFESKHPHFPWSRRVVYWHGRCLPLGWLSLSY